jgi:serine/threonine-protein kinase
VAAALPGGSPLEAALRAGETPSPEMVAASITSGGLSPATAWLTLALTVLGSAVAIGLGADAILWRHAAPERSPDVLADRARDLLSTLGHTGPSADRAFGFEVDLDQVREQRRRDPVGWRSARADPSFLRFWYRESPQPLEAWRFPFLYGNVSRLTATDPPMDLAGMTLVRLDPTGRLAELVVVPPADAPAADRHEPDWAAVLAHAGFEPAAWTSTTPARQPPVFADTRAAWTGHWPTNASLPVRLEAAALNGRAVYFEAVYPWTPPPRLPAPLLTTAERGAFLAAIVIFAALFIGTGVIARRNVRAGRSDRRGAFRLSVFVFSAMLVSWFFGESHVPTLWEVTLVVMALSLALLAAACAWLTYLAVEPFLRRRWPEVLVTWTRLMSGAFHDPLVGRDVLVGCAAGSLLAAAAMVGFLAPERVGVPSSLAFVDVYGLVYGVQGVVPLLTWRAAQSVLAGLSGVWALLLMRLALGGSARAAVAAFAVLSIAFSGIGEGDYWVGPLFTALTFGVFALLIARVGLLAAVVQFYVWGLFIFFPMTTDLGAWYAGAGVTALLVIAGLAAWGLTAALTRSTRA